MIDQLIAGDTLDFIDEAPDYPASAGWALVYRLVPEFTTPTQAPITLNATTYGTDQYQVTAGAATTAAWKAGTYTWARWVSKTDQRVSLGSGRLTVLPDPAQSTQGYDGRSHAEKMLDLVEAALEALRTGAKSYTIGDVSYTRADSAELVRLRSKYMREVANDAARKRLQAGQGAGRKIQVRFDG
jgi:hypothetical protein